MEYSNSALERVHHIPEIWSCIFGELDLDLWRGRPALARCCRVQRGWEISALKILWRRTNAAHLFKLLGPMTKTTQGSGNFWTFTEALDPQAWPRYFRIASCVRHLELKICGDSHLPKYDHHFFGGNGICPKDFSAALQLAASSRSQIFPSLRSIDCEVDSPNSTHQLMPTFPTSLEDIRLSLAGCQTDMAIGIRSLRLCTRLRFFACEALGQTNPNNTSQIAAAICEVLPHLPLLRIVQLEPEYLTNRDVWRALSTLPSLSAVRLSSSRGPLHITQTPFSPLRVDDGFVCLAAVEVPLFSSDSILFLQHPPENIPSLLLHVTGESDGIELAELLSAKWSALTRLTLTFTDPTVVWGMEEMEALFGLGRLTHLDISTTSNSSLEDEDFESISQAFPLMKILSICPEPIYSTESSKLTWRSMAFLAQYCPEIEHLGMYIDPHSGLGLPNAPKPNSPRFSKLSYIHFGLSNADPSLYDLATLYVALAHLITARTFLLTGGIAVGFSGSRGLSTTIESRASACEAFWGETMEQVETIQGYTDMLAREHDQTRKRLKEMEEKYEVLLGKATIDSM